MIIKFPGWPQVGALGLQLLRILLELIAVSGPEESLLLSPVLCQCCQ